MNSFLKQVLLPEMSNETMGIVKRVHVECRQEEGRQLHLVEGGWGSGVPGETVDLATNIRSWSEIQGGEEQGWNKEGWSPI